MLQIFALSVLLAGPLRPENHPQLFVHYMPWFQSKSYSKAWGWHWTMNKRNPDQKVAGQQDIASHYHPLIDAYDSADPDLIEYHVQLMKLTGIDGVFIDWYGNKELYDYGDVNRATLKLIPVLQKAGLKFSIVYEDRTVPNLVSKGIITDPIKAGQTLFAWMQTNWFGLASYQKFEGRPLLLNFGPEYYKGDAWNQLFAGLNPRPYYLSLDSKQGVADGTFGWPTPRNGAWLTALDSYYDRAKGLKLQVPPAFPRFDDFYADAGAQPTFGKIPDDSGRTYTQTLDRALKSGSPFIQLITWNDWGEGTVIEPSVEFRYRDLEATQRFRKTHLSPGFGFTADDLRLPYRLYELRKRVPGNPVYRQASDLLLAGKPAAARKLLSRFKLN